jgi:predicted nucleic acid-binding Zn ribbon protein
MTEREHGRTGGRQERRTRRIASPLSEVVDAYVRKHGLSQRLEQASVIAEWPELVGPKIANVAKPVVVLEGGILVVAVTSAAWAQELQMMSPMILEKLRARGKKISRILWRAG